jgi:hypothetical protein
MSSSSSRSETASGRDEESGGGEEGARDSDAGATGTGMSGGGIMTGERPSDAAGDAGAGVAAPRAGSAAVTNPTWRNRGSTPPDAARGGGGPRRMSIGFGRRGRRLGWGSRPGLRTPRLENRDTRSE